MPLRFLGAAALILPVWWLLWIDHQTRSGFASAGDDGATLFALGWTLLVTYGSILAAKKETSIKKKEKNDRTSKRQSI